MSTTFPFSTTAYSPQFCHAVTFELIKEGALNSDGTPKPDLGFVDDLADTGGQTKGGISQRAFPHLDIASLSLDQIVRIYHARYWRTAHCASWPPAVALCLFDAAIQHGSITAIKLLQEVSGCKADGKVGPKTRLAVTSIDQEYLLSKFFLRRARFYARIIKKNTSQVRFIEGWHNRLADLLNVAWEIKE